MKLIRVLQEYDPGRFVITIAGDQDYNWYIKIIENGSYTGEGSEEVETSETRFSGESTDLAKLEAEAIKVIRSFNP